MILEDYLLPYAHDTYGEEFVFQQDNVSVHTAKYTKLYFESENIRVIPWPSRSPDLNPIENLWGILSRKVYDNGRRSFNTKAELKTALLDSWASISTDTCHTLCASVKDQCFEVIYWHRRQIDY